MKNTLRLLPMITTFLMVLVAVNVVNGQSKSKFPDMGVQSADGCLACPGSEWNNATNITKKDEQFASTTMGQSEFCFMTSCFYTRGLIGSDFGFNLPATSTVNGIALQINRKADIVHAVKDSVIQLMKGYVPVGEKKKSNSFWPGIAHNKSYGGPTDLWGTTWTPAEINSGDFQVWLKAYNITEGYPTASVDFFRVTVFYADGFAKKSQTAEFDLSANALRIFPNPVADEATISFTASQKGSMNLVVFNSIGAQMLQINESVEAGLVSRTLSLGSLPSGNYFIHCNMEGKSWITSLVKE
ncbi:MAG: T9SS type A sorting domain-containing protein [Chitinophagales bacterium]